MPTGKFFTIQSRLNDLVLDMEGAAGEPGTKVVTWEFNGQDNQLWWQDSIAQVIRSKLNDRLVLEMKDDLLIVNDYSPDEYNQKWRVTGDTVSHYENDSLVLDIEAQNADPGANICSFEYNGQDNQHWNFNYQEPKYFYIHTKNERHSGKVMDVSTDDDAKVILYERKDFDDKNGNANQLFWEDRYGIIHSKMNDFVFDTSDDDKVHMAEYDPDVPKRQFVYSPSRIVLKNNRQRCLQIRKHDDLKPFSFFKIEEADYEARDYQKWQLEYVN